LLQFAPPWCCRLVLAGALVSLAPGQATPAPQAQQVHPRKSVALQVRSVAVSQGDDGAVVEISSNGALIPTITKLDGPPRLVIDLPGASATTRPRIPVNKGEVKSLRVSQYQQDPPIARIVVDLSEASNYAWETVNDKLLVRLHPLDQQAENPAAASGQRETLASYSAGEEPAVASGSGGTTGTILKVGDTLADGSSISAGEQTTVLNLTRGGQVRICPGTTISITNAQTGRDLMLGMSTGSVETHYTLAASADSVLTPDFRILLQGPGDLHYAISADSKGNTCVRSLPGNTAAAVVSELMGDGTYNLQPNEQVVFRGGQIAKSDAEVPIDCGCPESSVPILRADSGPPPISQPATSQRAANSSPSQPGEQAQVILPSGPAANAAPPFPEEARLSDPPPVSAKAQPTQMQIDIEAPLVFRASDPRPAPTREVQQLPALSARPAPMRIVVLPPGKPSKAASALARPGSNPNQPRGFFGHIRHFFSRIFS